LSWSETTLEVLCALEVSRVHSSVFAHVPVCFP